MSRLWSHPAYAEDQPWSKTILGTHVLHRGLLTGAMIGPLVGAARYTLLRRRSPITPPFLPYVVRSTGTGAVIGTGLLAIALVGRMWGREEIEWKDRSWRLLENKGQVEVDTWSVAGMAAGWAALVAMRGLNGVGWKMGIGSLGLGGTAGVMGYMVWRHGVNGGRWPE